RVFHELSSLTQIIFGALTVALGICMTPFIELWLGGRFALDESEVLVMVMVFFAIGSNQTTSQYRWSLGLFRPARFIPVIATILNIGLSVLLATNFGLFGILIASLVARCASFSIV